MGAPIMVCFYDVYYLTDEVVGREVGFPQFLGFLWKIASLGCNSVW